VASDVTLSPDRVSLGVLVSSVPRDVVDTAVAAHGVGPKRCDGTLPAHVVVDLRGS
jgi:Insertion element 4 transposase N-terminal